MTLSPIEVEAMSRKAGRTFTHEQAFAELDRLMKTYRMGSRTAKEVAMDPNIKEENIQHWKCS